MAVRIITSFAALPALIAILIFGGMSMKIGLAVVTCIGIFEFYRAFDENCKLNILSYLATILYVFTLDISDGKYSVIIITFYILFVLTGLVVYHREINIKNAFVTLFGFFYVTYMLSNVYLVRNMNNGVFYVWLVFFSAWMSDTGAYFTGKAIGKHKLIPSLSPNKTVEGAVGGVIFAGVSGYVFGLVVMHFFPAVGDIKFTSLFICFLGSIFAQFGDLTASSIKRYTKIKDFGKIIPGHGGVLDRFDSVLFTAPVVYMIILLLGDLV